MNCDPNLDRIIDRFGDRVYWLARDDKFYLRTPAYPWIPLKAPDLRVHLSAQGFFDDVEYPKVRVPEGEDQKKERKAAEKQNLAARKTANDFVWNNFLTHIRQKNFIKWAGDLAFYRSGFHVIKEVPLLVIQGFLPPPERPGNYGFILHILEELFSSPPEQLGFVLALLQHVYGSMVRGELFFCQTLIVAGAPEDGKSLFQKQIVSGLLGGRDANAANFLGDITVFNSELSRAEHLMIDDHVGGKRFDRSSFTDHIKETVSNLDRRVEAKYKTPINIPISQLISVVTNRNGKIALIPDFTTDDLEDKLIAVVSKKVSGLLGSVAANNARIAEQMPAFRYWLRKEYRPPAGVLLPESRYVVKAYRNPELLEEVLEGSAAFNILQIIQSFFEAFELKGSWEGTTGQLYELISENPHHRRSLDVWTKNNVSFGLRLKEIAKFAPEVITVLEHTKKGRRVRVKGGDGLVRGQPVTNVIPMA